MIRQNYFSVPTLNQLRNFSLNSLAGKNFLSIDDLSSLELKALIDRAIHYKEIFKGKELCTHQPLKGKSIAMIFQKRSTRTRVSAEVGIKKLGGQALFLSAEDIQLNANESIQDTALVLSRFVDLIMARVFGHEDIEELAKYSTVPVINALTDIHHPLQTLADYMTLKEHFGYLEGLTLAWVGDGNNIVHDLMLAAPKMGVNIKIATPEGYEPNTNIVLRAKDLIKKSNSSLFLTTEPIEAVRNSNVVVTDTFVSMGQESEMTKRLADFRGFQVNKELMSYAAPNAKFMHCLPRHQEEVDDAVFYSSSSIVFDEAENRMWTLMALISALLT